MNSTLTWDGFAHAIQVQMQMGTMLASYLYLIFTCCFIMFVYNFISPPQPFKGTSGISQKLQQTERSVQFTVITTDAHILDDELR